LAEHWCKWRHAAKELADKLAEIVPILEERDALIARIEQLERRLGQTEKQLLGPKSERMPTPDEEAKARSGERRKRGGHVNPDKRKKNAAKLAALPTTIVEHPVVEEQRRCGHCGESIKPITPQGDTSVEYEWVPGHLERRVHRVEVGRCPCKQHYARGPAPRRVVPGCLYGPAFIGKLVVDRCADATPIHRVEKSMRRRGVPISRSTMNALVLLAGEVLAPLREVQLGEVRDDPHVQADETSFRTQARAPERSFVWTFLSKQHTVYEFAGSRSGETPEKILGGSKGSLTADGHTGYNVVTDVEGRTRSGCWSHARRKIYEAMPTAIEEAREGLDLILELFMIEREAKERGIVGTDKHLRLRRRKSAPVIEQIRKWRERTAALFEPKSAMGEALTYLRNQWQRLTVFLDDAQVPIHNNASESALRIVALARKNSLFFFSEETGKKVMVLHSLVATCERHGVNPEAYLADVLLRIRDQPKERLADLLPHRWKETFGSGFDAESRAAPAEAT